MKFTINDAKIKYLRMLPAGLSLEAHSDCLSRLWRERHRFYAGKLKMKLNAAFLRDLQERRRGGSSASFFNQEVPKHRDSRPTSAEGTL